MKLVLAFAALLIAGLTAAVVVLAMSWPSAHSKLLPLGNVRLTANGMVFSYSQGFGQVTVGWAPDGAVTDKLTLTPTVHP